MLKYLKQQKYHKSIVKFITDKVGSDREIDKFARHNSDWQGFHQQTAKEVNGFNVSEPVWVLTDFGRS